MNKSMLFALTTFVFAFGGTAVAADGWLLLFDNDHHLLAHATDSQMEEVAALGNYTLYGSTDQVVAAVSFDTNRQAGKFVVVEKAGKKAVRQWPISLFPATQMSGPSADLLLVGEYGYFVSIRWGPGNSILPNALGGSFDLNRISLNTGQLDSVALPKELLGPRPGYVPGAVLVSDGIAERTWCVDFERNSVSKLTAPSSEPLPWPREGEIRAVLGEADEGARQHRRQDTESARREIVRVIPTDRNDGSSLAVVSKYAGRVSIVDLDQRHNRIARELELPSDVVPETIQPLSDGATVFAVLSTRSVQLVRADGSMRTLWTIPNGDSGVLHEVRVLSVRE